MSHLEMDAEAVVPAIMIPSYRVNLALQYGVNKSCLLTTWGGIGDQICAEPTLRFALENFKKAEWSLLAPNPELYTHLKFKDVIKMDDNFSHQQGADLLKKYLVFNTSVPHTHMVWEFINHMITNCVDHPAMCAFRCQLPIKDRAVRLASSLPREGLPVSCGVAVHPGKHWESKTFPADWWNDVLLKIKKAGFVPHIIGSTAQGDMRRGTVDVDTTGCIDLRDKYTLLETVHLLKHSKVVLTNDSSPLHMAVPGNAWIGFFATSKHPDFITHWRNDFLRGTVTWGHKMHNLSLGGIWEVLDYCPNQMIPVNADAIDQKTLRSWLPKPDVVADWVAKVSHL